MQHDMKISVSQIKRHVECPMKAHYEYTLLRGTERRPIALDVGSLAHIALEAKLKGVPWIQATEAYLADLPPEVSVEAGEEFANIAPSIALWKKPEDWEVLGTEVEMEIPVGVHTIVGRLDAPIAWNTGIWHLQHKTLASSVPVSVFCEQQRTDWHECVYHRMLQAAYPMLRVEGTVLNIIRKLSAKRLVESPQDALIPPQYLPRTDEIVQEALDDLAQLIDDIEAGRNGTHRIIKCRSACGGPYRNSLCIYKPVCDGDVSIESDSFVDLEPRYADV